MKNSLRKSFEFIRSNPGIIYSLMLLLIIPIVISVNIFYILTYFERNFDSLTKSKAVLAENIINLAAKDSMDNPDQLTRLIGDVQMENEEVRQFEFLTPNLKMDSFKVIASSELENVGKDSNEVQNILAWNQEEGIGFIGTDGRERFWKITKLIRDAEGQKAGLVSLAFSQAYPDSLITSTINRSFVILIVTVAIALLLVINNARLFGYAITVSRLKEVDKMKDTFISMASHELRSPLTAIRGYAEILKDKKEISASSESRRFVDNIGLSADRLQDLVNDILEVSRIEGNQLHMEIKDFDPNEVISQTIEEMRPQTLEKDLSLAFKPIAEPVLIRADIDRTKQILVNLISNAIKYTPKGSVDISTNVKDDKFIITVADSGIGISSEDQMNLFQKFSRIKNEQTRNVMGTGLGLWIIREIARHMDGKITLESIEGVGSHFSVYLPIAKS